MLVKFPRLRRSRKGGGKKKTRQQAKQQTKEESPTTDLEPCLTMTLSEEEDSEAPPVFTDISHAAGDDAEVSFIDQEESFMTEDDDESVVARTFTQNEIMQNELNHIRQIAAKDREIAKMNVVLEELKSTFEEKLVEKDQVITQKDIEIAEKDVVIAQKEHELVETKAELVETKNTLGQVSSVLMECQHELHEVTTTPNLFSFWGVWG